MQPQIVPFKLLTHGFSGAARATAPASTNIAHDTAGAVSHVLGNDMYLEETPIQNSNDCVLTVRCRKTHAACPQVLAAAIGMDVSGNSINRSWLPEGVNILSRLRATTCYRENAPRLALVG